LIGKDSFANTSAIRASLAIAAIWAARAGMSTSCCHPSA
jgi:hypothetical protein